MNYLVNMIIQIAITLLLAPLINGVIRKIKAFSQHRRGAPVLQLYYDIFKLMRKDIVISKNASWIFNAAPYIYLISAVIAAVTIPAVPQLFSLPLVSDAVAVVYIMAAGRIFLTLSGLDTGSTFGGMGSSRELMISSLHEPSFIIVLFTLGLSPVVGSTNMKAIYTGSIEAGWGIISPVYMMLMLALLVIIIAETSRIPVDDPATHLELTMVHEAMVLEYSGRHLAFIHMASAVKQLVFINLFVNIFMPFGSSFEMGISLIAAVVLYIIKVFIVAAIIAVIEINTVKLRLFSIPNIAALALILSVLGFMSGFVFGR